MWSRRLESVPVFRWVHLLTERCTLKKDRLMLGHREGGSPICPLHAAGLSQTDPHHLICTKRENNVRMERGPHLPQQTYKLRAKYERQLLMKSVCEVCALECKTQYQVTFELQPWKIMLWSTFQTESTVCETIGPYF